MNVFKSSTSAVLFAISASLLDACATSSQGVGRIPPDQSDFIQSVHHTTSPQIESSNASKTPGSDSVSTSGLPDIQQINQSGINVRSTVQNPISSNPTFHYKDEKGNEIIEYRERGMPSEIEVRSSVGTHYELSEPADPSQMPSRFLRGVPSVRLTY